jgi:hypothetical protein
MGFGADLKGVLGVGFRVLGIAVHVTAKMAWLPGFF